MIWHYTTYDRLLRILGDGMIRPATAHVPEGERPVVWFSFHPFWEPTATKGIVIGGVTRDATEEEMGGLVRIGVEEQTAPYRWHQINRLSGMSSGEAKRL